MSGAIELKPIGAVRGGRREATDDDWDAVEAVIALDAAQFKPDATASLGDFSHVEVVFHFNRVPDAEVNTGARHPRGRMDWPLVGIFAQRGKGRPNRIGVTACRRWRQGPSPAAIIRPRTEAGTPVLDIKPVMTGFLPRGAVREPAWARELMAGYW